MLVSHCPTPLSMCDSSSRDTPDDRGVPQLPARRKTDDDVRILFEYHPRSRVMGYLELQVQEETFLFMKEGVVYARILTEYGIYLLKQPQNGAELEVSQQIRDQLQMGIFNPNLADLLGVEDQFGKIAFYDSVGCSLWSKDTRLHLQMHENKHIVKVYAFISNLTNGALGVLMEWPLFGSAEQYCPGNAMDDEMILLWAYQLLAALKFCHLEYKVVHGDIRPCNVFVFKNNYVKWANFAYSHPLSPQRIFRSDEQKLYSAPEILPNQDQEKEPLQHPLYTNISRYGFSSDIWSFAMLLYFIKHLRNPNESIELDSLKEQLESGSRPQLREDMSSTLKRVIEACWRTEKRDSSGDILPLEQKRPTASDLLKFLDYN